MSTENQDKEYPSNEEMRSSVIRLAFSGKEAQFNEFCELIRAALPEAEAAVLRGSSITGYRWKDGLPFDSEGPGTSDLDLTLVGGDVLRYFSLTGFYVPGIHTRPLCDENLDVAPELLPLRERLMKMVNRPVNIQGSRDWIQYLRGDIMGQPYLTLFGVVGQS